MTRRLLLILPAAAVLLAGCTSGKGSPTAATVTVTAGSSTPATSATSSSPKPTPKPTPKATPVHISSNRGDGETIGVGLPLVFHFNKKVTDATEFDRATTVVADGKQVDGAWYWADSDELDGTLEAHWRPRVYWPAHASIQFTLKTKGLSAGKGLAFDNDLSLSLQTNESHISYVDCTTDRMKVTADGRTIKTLPVSCGRPGHNTLLGTKVVIDKKNPEHMVGDATDPYHVDVNWSVRLTNSGEYIHSAPWNPNVGVDNESHGCTNLNPADAQWYFGWAQIGDVVTFTNTGGSKVTPTWDGLGDWNLPWQTYKQGGKLQNPDA